jgi:uncharacterized protein (DUF1499 family)
VDTPEDTPTTPPHEEPTERERPWQDRPWLGIAVLALACSTALLAALAGFGSRWGVWHFRTGFSMLRWAAYAAVAVSIVSAVTLWFTRPGTGRRGFWLVVLGLVVSIPVFAIPLGWRARAGDVPPIHDITTDTNDPPPFVEIVPLRADAPNPVEYPGVEVAIQQREAYPDIRPVILDEPLPQAFERALQAARAEGWEIVGTDPPSGRIEATDRTFWFGFRDDVVIRLTPNGDRTILDIRSKSRVGGSDVGTNAERIRGFLARLGA